MTDNRNNTIVNMNHVSTSEPDIRPCIFSEHRRCDDGSCASKLDMCPEEQLANQTTIFILITVGMIVVLLLVIFYCFQKKSQRSDQSRNTDQTSFFAVSGDEDNTSMYMPPPAYEEAVSSSFYTTTSGLQRNIRLPSSEEPRTPPPNYDAALYILAHNHNSVCPTKEEPISPVVRRSISTEFGSAGSSRAIRSSDFARHYSIPDAT